MGSSGEEPKGIDATAGGLVWVRRRNGSWWPGKILGPDELPEGCIPMPRAGTPVQLLGREDASVDWYNLEKSKRVKAFHCGEYDDCINRVKALASNPSKRAAKYARREDAILHALEIENDRLGKDHQNLSATPDTQDTEHHQADESPSASHPSEECENEGEDVNSSGDDSESGQEVSQSGVSFEGPDHDDSAKEESKQQETENDSEDDGSDRVKRMRGLEDLGMGLASLRKRKRSKISQVHELYKRKKHRTLTKVMECATVVSVPVCEKLSTSTGPTVPVASDIKVSGVESYESKINNSVVINNNSDSSGVPCENGTLSGTFKHGSDASLKHKQKGNETSSMPVVPENGSVQKLFDVPLVADEKNSAGLSSIVSDESKQTLAGVGAQSSESSHVEAISTGNETYNESVSTSSGTLEWQIKGRRNSRTRKVDLDNKDETHVDPNNLGQSLVSNNGGNRVKSRPVTAQLESHAQGSTSEQLVPQRSLPYRLSRSMVNPKYLDSECSHGNRRPASGLYDVDVQVKTSYRPQHVPYISLMSKLTGRPIIGHPLTIKVLKDGSSDNIISSSKFEYSPNEDIFAPKRVGKHKGRGRPSSKRGSSHSQSSLSKSPNSRRNGLLSKKTRKLSSLTGSRRPSREEMKPVVEQLKGPSVACVPLKVVFSRINAALTSSVRVAPRLNATSGI